MYLEEALRTVRDKSPPRPATDTYRAVAARDLLLRNASCGVQEMQCACRRNGLFALFQYANMLSGAQRRRYMNKAELIGNVDHLLLFRNGA